ncbi:SDR family NAD(P)-dependent oxidoreductase [Neptunicoccus cionae]|uniref:SDR family oxidoreductase n=1 Tax=Neptunicoccus cionae TaxID=2035344 RepID=A0A916QXP9_9RHOB|nr:SDR family NAD(P)-dependent oxidoreductase [Amylibacter cionae]GGA18626.1 SDR family oxidoreductase [Amylibacter cionae]
MTDSAAKRALVLGGSGGIGRALAEKLRADGHDVTTLSRSADGFDITDETAIEQALGRLDAPFHLIITATGALTSDNLEPEKSLKALDPETLAAQFAVNATGPALVLKHAQRLLPKRERAVFAALSARVGSIGDNSLGGWYSYRASKAALNQLIHTAAIELGRSHKQAICVVLHPGTVTTPFTENYRNHASVPPEDAAANLIRVLDDLTPDQSGQFFDWAGKPVPW